jgi:dTDP-4-dehydrorhamnose 3,5-epimerase
MLEPEILSNFKSFDERGSFVKIFDRISKQRFAFDIKETFFSRSLRGVLRGMHFQLPPRCQRKLVTCIEGEVIDVLVDLRISRGRYGEVTYYTLTDKTSDTLYIPEGFAHGFMSLSERATLLYQCSEDYSSDHDTGIHWQSVGINWPFEPIEVSSRDQKFKDFKDLKSPFL